jgi:pyruvate,water dikinase
VRAEIDRLTRGHADRTDDFVEGLSRGLSRIAAIHDPRPVIVRRSDFKTNEYAALLGVADVEPAEENPMIGFRGASRSCSDDDRDGFALKCRALKAARELRGFDNIAVMVPFRRTPEEADRVLAGMAAGGLARGKDGLELCLMCEIPAKVTRAEEFARRCDGFPIGSNDLAQLTPGVDRGSERLARLFREDDPAVPWMIREVIARAHAAGAKVGLCDEAPATIPPSPASSSPTGSIQSRSRWMPSRR